MIHDICNGIRVSKNENMYYFQRKIFFGEFSFYVHYHESGISKILSQRLGYAAFQMAGDIFDSAGVMII